MRGKNQRFDVPIDFHKFRVSARDRDGRYQVSSYGELRFSKSRWNIINSIIWNIGRSIFQCKEQKRQHYHRECFHKWEDFQWDFDRKKGSSFGRQRTISLNVEKNYCFSGKFGLSGIDATNQINASSSHYSTWSVIFQTEFLMEELELVVAEEELVVAEEDKFEIGAK